MNAIILAGGKATRLGPLATQLSKCLITVGQQPMLIHQLNALRDRGVTNVVVVTSRSQVDQIEAMLQLAYDTADMRVVVIEQRFGKTPVDALVDGLEWLVKQHELGPTYMLAADAFIERLPLFSLNGDMTWAHVVVQADLNRTWTVMGSTHTQWHDRRANVNEEVFTGIALMHPLKTFGLLVPHRTFGELTMSQALNILNAKPWMDPGAGWLDVGDLQALAHARRTRYVARTSNRLELDDDGVVWKSSDERTFMHEIDYMYSVHEHSGTSLLFPRMFTWDGPQPTPTTHTYGTEHIDQPTLAELWLYWPGDQKLWAGILHELVERMDVMWSRGGFPRWATPKLVDDAEEMYLSQFAQRLAGFTHPITKCPWLFVNNERLLAGDDLIKEFMHLAVKEAKRPKQGLIHGDLAFVNILWSITTGQPKLLDPRGVFGKTTGMGGDIRYDLAKLRYSYHGGVAAILHELYDLEWHDTIVTFDLMPARHKAANFDLLDAELNRVADIDEVAVLEALTCLAAPVLHQANEREAVALYIRGVQLANELI